MTPNDVPQQQMHLVPVTDPQGYCPIRSTLAWFKAAGQFDGNTMSVRQVAFYTGMQIEELAEKMAIFMGKTNEFVQHMDRLADAYKTGDYDTAVELAMRSDAEGVLDADIDLIWVSIGAGGAAGADVANAYRAVGRANWAKFPDGQVTRHAGTGKVIKPEGWQPADLAPYTFFNRQH